MEFTANDHAPGYFRNTYRLLDAQGLLDADTATSRLLLELASRVEAPGELPSMLDAERQTLDGLLILALRSVQATSNKSEVARVLGEELLRVSLGLDPARDAFNADHPETSVKTIDGGALALATAADWALREAAHGFPRICMNQAFSTDTSWDPGDAEVAWVDEVCYPDQYVGEYCEQDRWIEGECLEDWVPEDCVDGYYRDDGYYEYYCYSEDDCRYIWRDRWVYVDGYCSGGYYDEWCESGYWELGICYDGTFVPGYCDPGHYEYRFPGGVWTFAQYATAPAECDAVRPGQYAIAVAAARVLHAKAYDFLEPEWQSALDVLLEEAPLDEPNEATLDAVQQIINAVIAAEVG